MNSGPIQENVLIENALKWKKHPKETEKRRGWLYFFARWLKGSKAYTSLTEYKSSPEQILSKLSFI